MTDIEYIGKHIQPLNYYTLFNDYYYIPDDKKEMIKELKCRYPERFDLKVVHAFEVTDDILPY